MAMRLKEPGQEPAKEKSSLPDYSGIENPRLRSLLVTLSKEAAKPASYGFVKVRDLGKSEKELKQALIGMVKEFPDSIS